MRYTFSFTSSAVLSVALAQSTGPVTTATPRWQPPSLPFGPIPLIPQYSRPAPTNSTSSTGARPSSLQVATNPVLNSASQAASAPSPPAIVVPAPLSLTAASVSPTGTRSAAPKATPTPAGNGPYGPYPYPYGYPPQGQYPQFIPQFAVPPGYTLEPITKAGAGPAAAPSLPPGWQYALLPNGQFVPVQVPGAGAYPGAYPVAPYPYAQYPGYPPAYGQYPYEVPQGTRSEAPSGLTPVATSTPAYASPAAQTALSSTFTSLATATTTPTLATQNPNIPAVPSKPAPLIAEASSAGSFRPSFNASTAPVVAPAKSGTLSASPSPAGATISITLTTPVVETPTVVVVPPPAPASATPEVDPTEPPPLVISPQEISASPNQPYPVQSSYSAPPIDGPTSTAGGPRQSPVTILPPINVPRPGPQGQATPRPAASPRPVSSAQPEPEYLYGPYGPEPSARPTTRPQPTSAPLPGYIPAIGYTQAQASPVASLPAAEPSPEAASAPTQSLPFGILNPAGSGDTDQTFQNGPVEGNGPVTEPIPDYPRPTNPLAEPTASDPFAQDPYYAAGGIYNDPPRSSPSSSSYNPYIPSNPFRGPFRDPFRNPNRDSPRPSPFPGPKLGPTSIATPRPNPTPTPRPGPARPRPSDQPRPRPAASPRPIVSNSNGDSCGTGVACPRGQFCYDKSRQSIVSAQNPGVSGVCFSGTCRENENCGDGQICTEGRCGIKQFNCGPGYGECPDADNWRCAGRGLSTLFTGYCVYDPSGGPTALSGFLSGISGAFRDGGPFRDPSPRLPGLSSFWGASALDGQQDVNIMQTDTSEVDASSSTDGYSGVDALGLLVSLAED